MSQQPQTREQRIQELTQLRGQILESLAQTDGNIQGLEKKLRQFKNQHELIMEELRGVTGELNSLVATEEQSKQADSAKAAQVAAEQIQAAKEDGPITELAP